MPRLAPIFTVLVTLLPVSLLGQQEAVTAGFVSLLGSDTVTIERTIRRGNEVRGVYVERSPRVTIWRYTATLAPDGTVQRFEFRGERSVQGPTFASGVMVFSNDSATIETHRGDQSRTQTVAVRPGAVPGFLYSYGLYEQAIHQAVQSRADSFPFDLLLAGSTRPRPNAVERISRDTVAFSYFGNPMLALVDGHGRILAVTGRQTTAQVEVSRVDELDVEALAREFLTGESSGRSLGTLSPRDTARATIQGADLFVDYSRPSRRGRVIFGSVVPWEQVWRTGANAATQFNTSADLQIGNAVIPTGTYTLWTVPTPDGATLIVNKQIGQWGTEYHDTEDLVRVTLHVEELATPVELFTISIQQSSAGGVLVMDWDRTRWSMPFAVRP
jgi:hypothetical protein